MWITPYTRGRVSQKFPLRGVPIPVLLEQKHTKIKFNVFAQFTMLLALRCINAMNIPIHTK